MALVTFTDAGLTAIDLLFSSLTFSISANDRIGLIAGNGRGKTSFLNIVTGERDLKCRQRHQGARSQDRPGAAGRTRALAQPVP